MYPLRVALSLETIEALAPDQASLTAARKLLRPAIWPTLAEGDGLVWGECQGSGSTPYRVVVSEIDAGYKCSCPSRKFPCKHSLALMWMRAEGKSAFTPTAVPDWVKDWLSRRRGPGGVVERGDTGDAAKPSIRLAESAEPTAVDPKSEARAEAARERNRLEREAAIVAGLDDLDVWLNDQVEKGMASFVVQSAKECRAIVQRLVDAKAPGLATRMDALASKLLSLPESNRPYAAIEELGQVHLIAEAYRRQAKLPPGLVADVRHSLGWITTREALLADETALRIQGIWRVVAVLSEVQPDRLRRIETWLWLEGGENRRVAVLVDFVPVASGPAGSGYSVGDRITAELVFYPSALPLRAQIVRVSGDTRHANQDLAFPTSTLTETFGHYEQALAQLPWLTAWPLTFHSAEVRRAGESLFLAEVDDGLALRLVDSQSTTALPLARVGPIEGFGIWDGYRFTLCWAQTSLGRWVNA